MQNFDGVVSVFFRLKLNKAITLMLIGHFVSRDMHICYGARLQEQFPNQLFVDSRLQVAHIDRSFLVTLEDAASKAVKDCIFVHVAGATLCALLIPSGFRHFGLLLQQILT